MKIAKQSRIIVKKSLTLNDAINFDVELWAQLGGNSHARLVSFFRKDDTIHFASINGIHDQMPLEELSVALWQVPIVGDVDLPEDRKEKVLMRILTTGSNYGTVRFDTLPGSEKSGQEQSAFRQS